MLFGILDYTSGISVCIEPFKNVSLQSSCLTLSELAENTTSFSRMDNLSLSLVFLEGNHNLCETLSIFEVDSFSMESMNSNPLETAITCNESVSLNFHSVDSVRISSLTFKGCIGSRISGTKNFVLQYSVFLGNGISGGQHNWSSALIVDRSVVEIMNTTFTNFTGSMWSLHGIKSRKYIKLNHSVVGGAIISSRSNVTIENSIFYQNSAQLGGVIFAEASSNITIIGSTFMNNSIYCHQLFCYGSVIFSDISSVQITYSNCSGNMNTQSDLRKVTRGGALGAFYSTLIIHECVFDNNIATYGGAFFLRYCKPVTISSATFSNNKALTNGGVAYVKNCEMKVIAGFFVGNTALKSAGVFWTESAYINVNNSCFYENVANNLGGAVKLTEKSNFIFFQCNFTSNKAYSNGGAIFASRANTSITNSYFKNNAALSGGAAYVLYGAARLENCVFAENLAQLGVISFYHSSGFVWKKLSMKNNFGSLYFVDSKFLVKPKATSEVIISNNRPHNSHSGDGNHYIQEGGGITSILSNIELFGYIRLHNNSANNGGGILALSSRILLSGKSTVDNNEAANTGGGIYLYQTILALEGTLTLSNNIAQESGGGIHFVSSLLMPRLAYLNFRNKPVTHVKFTSNSAHRGGGACLEENSKFYMTANKNSFSFIRNEAQYGGAVYVSDQTNKGACTSSQETVTASLESDCFFQSVSALTTDKRVINIEKYITFSDNHANVSGETLYGGLLDRCTINVYSNTTTYNKLRYSSLPNFLKDIVNSTASKAVRVCFCSGYGTVDCDYQPETIEVMKGELFTLLIVAVDHVNHTVSTNIRSYLSNKGSRLGNGQKVQHANSSCTELNYWVYSNVNRELLTLYAKGPCKDAGISKRQVPINILPCKCPLGFHSHVPEKTKCKCECDSEIQKYLYCNPLLTLIQRRSDVWINSVDNISYFIFPHCPFDYCLPPTVIVNVTLENSKDAANVLCAFNRSGLLCSSCQPGLSLSLGSSRCIQCPKHWPALFVVITICACLAGLVLVFVMLALNLTVSTGTLNGIIFYANILSANKTIILPFSKPNFITVILAWLNLDIGFETCYFEGMDAYAKAWIELCFPLYVTFLVAVIILLCKYSTKFSSIVGKRNPVSTLATLILFSYAKLLQSTISAMSFAVLKHPNRSKEVVWRPDANVRYITGKHSALFLVAIFLLVLGMAYTVLLFSWQWLLSLSHLHLFKWVQNTKLSSFMDAYHAPYTPKKRYWTGLLLFARIIVYLVSAINVSGEPSINLLAISLVVTSLFIMKYNIYKVWLIDVLETALFVNLIMFSIGKLYLLRTETDHAIIAYVSTGIAVLLLSCIIFYHVITSLPISLKSWMHQAIKKFGNKTQASENDLTTPFIDEGDEFLPSLASSSRQESTY